MKRRVKIIPLYVVCIILGLAMIFLLNRIPITEKISGIHLPFGWEDRPHYSLLECEPSCYYLGLPFTAEYRDDHVGGWYVNNTAGWLDVSTGIALGLGAAVAVRRKLK